MHQSLSVIDFLKKGKIIPVIDVRSEGEFGHAHIPGAINIPLFNNEERAAIGTAYKQINQETAMLMGLDIIGPKMSGIIRKVAEIAPSREVLVHCWRGGMRSQSFATLLATFGFKVGLLKGGYKNYRNHVLEVSERKFNFKILSGKTGSGKTEILHEIAKAGHQMIDLEGIANHKGSSYGMLGQAPQPSNEMFENLLAEKLDALDSESVIWLEDESRNIGKCCIQAGIWAQMEAAEMVFIDVSTEIRTQRLVNEYAQFSYEALKERTDAILKRLGGQNHKAAIEALQQGDFHAATKIALYYYDKAYLNGLAKREPSKVKSVEIKEDNPKKTAEIIVKL